MKLIKRREFKHLKLSRENKSTRTTFDLTPYSVHHLNLLVVSMTQSESRQQLSCSHASQHVVEDVEVSLSPETHHHTNQHKIEEVIKINSRKGTPPIN